MTRFTAGLAALLAVALIAACGGSSEPDSETNIVRPALPAETTTTESEPDKKQPASTTQTQNGPPETPFEGPVVKLRVRNGLCTPDSPAAPANKDFQLQIRATDRSYSLVFDGKRRFSVPKGVTGKFVIAGHAADEPVLTIFGEPCAVIRIS